MYLLVVLYIIRKFVNVCLFPVYVIPCMKTFNYNIYDDIARSVEIKFSSIYIFDLESSLLILLDMLF